MTPGQASLVSFIRLGGLALLWGSSFLWIAIALEGLSPAQIVVVRLVLGALVLTMVLKAARRRLPASGAVWGHLAAAAVLGNVIPYFLFAAGQQSVSSGLAGSLNATTPLWALLIGLAVRTEPTVGAIRAAGLLLGFLGALTILAPWEEAGGDLWGSVACLGAAFSYGASYVYIGRFLRRSKEPAIILSATQLIAAAGISLAVAPAFSRELGPLTWGPLAAVTVLGVLGTGAAYVLNYRLITDEGPTFASTVTYLLPVVAVSLGVLVLGEPLSAHLILGTALVLIGLGLIRRYQVVVARPRV